MLFSFDYCTIYEGRKIYLLTYVCVHPLLLLSDSQNREELVWADICLDYRRRYSHQLPHGHISFTPNQVMQTLGGFIELLFEFEVYGTILAEPENYLEFLREFL